MENGKQDQQRIAWEIIDQSPSIALRVTGAVQRWHTVYITKSVARYGYDWEDFMQGKIHWSDIVHPEDLPDMIDTVNSYNRLGVDQYNLHYRIVTPTGQSVWMNDQSTVQRGEGGEILYIDCVVSDYSAIRESLDIIEDNVRQQAVMTDILQSLHDADVEQAFPIILDRTGKYLNISRVVLFQDSPDHSCGHIIHEWCNEGVSSARTRGDDLLNYKRDIPEVARALANSGICRINFGQIPPRSQAQFTREGVVAAAIFAVYMGEERFGFISFDECVQERSWEDKTLFFLETVVKLISTAVARRETAVAARMSQETMRTVLDHVPTYICVAHPETGEAAFVNRALRELAGGDDITKSEIYQAMTACRQNTFFEARLPQKGLWLGVQGGDIDWVDGRRMRLYSAQDITERKAQEEYIRGIAFVDHLTRLPNRYRLDSDLEEAITRARDMGQTGCVLFIDMDDFKVINDSYGHDYGDAMLRAFSGFLQEACAGGNQVFRFGGDEFVVLVPPENANAAQALIDRMVARAREPWDALGKTFYCTISIGVVAYPDGEMGGKEIIKNADIAMYAAKNKGKNSYACYAKDMNATQLERARMETMLRQSIAGGFSGFSLHYQPIVDAFTGGMNGAEALLRWQPEGEFIPPSEFIPLAEYLGLIVPLGEQVLGEAARALKWVNDRIDKDFYMSVNVSIRQLQQPDIVNRFVDIISQSGANPANLVLEITEGMEVTDRQRVLRICNELRRRGMCIAMDDFGTGYSSLSNLREMPVDIIKIDRSFVRDVGSDLYANSFIRMITDLGHSIKKSICVEGVETQEQMDYCRDALVDMVQGFLLHRPMPLAQLKQVLERSGR